MVIFTEKEKLKNGEWLTIKAIKTPAEEYEDRIFSYINPKMPWRQDTYKRVNGDIADQCKDMFFIGEIDGEIVSLMWYTISGDVGTYGMVSTSEKHRNKGIYGCIMKYCIQFMDSELGLQAVYLAVSNPLAYKIYKKNGWQPYNNGTLNGTCIMRRLTNWNIDEKEFDDNYYKKQQNDGSGIIIRKVIRGDLPKLEALYNLAESTVMIKDYNASIYKGTAVECQIIDLINKMEAGEGQFYCIENALGRIVGAATLYNKANGYSTGGSNTEGSNISSSTANSTSDERSIKILDFFTHPNYEGYTKSLISKIIEYDAGCSKDNIISYIAPNDKNKADILYDKFNTNIKKLIIEKE
jgi:GNAT superfamily N-acetyltransferase